LEYVEVELPEELIERARKVAEAEGMTVEEIIVRFVQDELDELDSVS